MRLINKRNSMNMEKDERDQKLFDEFINGAAQCDLVDKYELALATVRGIINKYKNHPEYKNDTVWNCLISHRWDKTFNANNCF